MVTEADENCRQMGWNSFFTRSSLLKDWWINQITLEKCIHVLSSSIADVSSLENVKLNSEHNLTKKTVFKQQLKKKKK